MKVAVSWRTLGEGAICHNIPLVTTPYPRPRRGIFTRFCDAILGGSWCTVDWWRMNMPLVVRFPTTQSPPFVLSLSSANLFRKYARPCSGIWSWCHCVDRDGGGRENVELLTHSASEQPVEVGTDGSTREPSRVMQTKTVDTPFTEQKGSTSDAKGLRLQRADGETNPETLLAQKHIRVLLAIDALYSVCACKYYWHLPFPCRLVGPDVDKRISSGREGVYSISCMAVVVLPSGGGA